MTHGISGPRATDAGPDRGSGEEESTTDPPPPARSTGRVPLDRLLSVVVLSPAQASLVAVQVLDAAHRGASANGTHPVDTCLWTVTLTPSGDVDMGRAQAGGGTRVTELLEQLGQNARRLPSHPRSEQLVLLRRLEQAAADPHLEPGARARELEAALVEALGSGARQRLSGQLAALVDAFSRVGPSVAAPVVALPAVGGSRPGPHRAPTRSAPSRPPRRGHALSRRRTRTRRAALVVLLLTAALAGSGYVALRSPGNGIAGALGRDNQPAAPPTTPPAGSLKAPAKHSRPPAPHHIKQLAGRHAGPITGVQVQRTSRCMPGAPCPLTVTVHFRPASTTRPVAWKVGVARRCANRVTWSRPITVTAQPGWTSVYASSSVPVPRGRALALVALTTAPARAQSPPVPLTGSSLRCSSGHAQR